MSEQSSTELMEIYLGEVLSRRAFGRIPEIAADDMIDHTQPSARGPAALDAHARGFCENIADLEIEIVSIFGTPDTAVGIWRWRGHPRVPHGVSAKGSPVSPRLICSVFQVQDGKIRDYRAFVDAVDVLTQFAG
ncbi:MAG TPA: ester cyclase [Pseudomonadales bacterium]